MTRPNLGWSFEMSLRILVAASALVGAACLVAVPGFAQTPQKALPDTAPPRSAALPQTPSKTAMPRTVTTEDATTPPAQALPAPPRAAATK
jgi:hypothetical protein